MGRGGGGSRRPRIVLASFSLDAPFVLEDIRILSGLGELTTVHCPTTPSLPLHAGHGAKLVTRLLARLGRVDLLVSWFLQYYTVPMATYARATGTPLAVVLAGGDCARLPEIGYGEMCSPWKRRSRGRALAAASVVMPVSAGLARDLAASISVPEDRFRLLPSGFDPEVWQPGGSKEPLVLTVGQVTETTLARKGLLDFARLSRHLPDVGFALVGASPGQWTDRLRKEGGQNLELVPPVPVAELLPWYQRAAVYCQLSRYEGLPNALCQAMLAGCVPVGTMVASIPEIVGDSGLLVAVGDLDGAAAAVRRALVDGGRGAAARARIVERYSLRSHREILEGIVQDLLDGRCPRGPAIAFR